MKNVPIFTGFWAYDLFGYLLPGTLVVVAVAKFNSLGHDLIAERWNVGKAHDVVLLVGIAYILGHLVAAASSYLLEKAALRKALGYPTAAMFPSRPEATPIGLWARAWRSVRRVLFPGYYRPYTDEFQLAVSTRFEATFGFPATDDHDRFWVIWSWVALHHPVAHRRATHFLDLYGFSRNTSFACLVVAALALLPHFACPGGISRPFWVTGWFLAAVTLFSNYTKLMRRMDDEVYRAFVAAPREDHLPRSGGLEASGADSLVES